MTSTALANELVAKHVGTKKEERSKSEGDGAQEPRPPVADRQMYAGVLGEIVRAADPTTEADPVGVLASLLAGVGVLVGRAPHLQIGNTRHPLLIWPLLFGRTGSGRKGEATETAERFLRATDRSGEYSSLTVSGLSSGEGLIERIRDPDPDKAQPQVETMPKRLLVVEPEFSSVMARAKREGSTLAAVLRQAWDGKPLSVMNRAALKASSSHVGIIGHITPKEFRLRLAEADMAGGTFNRFMPLWVERSKRVPIPEGIDAAQLDALAKRLRDGIDAANGIGRVQLGRDAAALWQDKLYDELTACDDDDYAWTEFIRRAAPYCQRVAALHAILEGRQVLGVSDLQAAGALARYSIDSAKYVLDRQRKDPKLDRLRRAIDSAPTGLTRSAVSDLFSRNVPKDELDTLLDTLLTDDAYESVVQSTGGRPAELYRRAAP